MITARRFFANQLGNINLFLSARRSLTGLLTCVTGTLAIASPATAIVALGKV